MGSDPWTQRQPDSFHRPLHDDNRRGAAELARVAAASFRAAATASAAADAATLRAELLHLGRGLIAAQPAMAPLFTLAADVVAALPADGDTATARAAALAAIDAFCDRLGQAHRQVVARAQGLIPPGARVLTISASSTVRETLMEASRRRAVEAFCLEGRPNLEGRALAAELAAGGVRVRAAADAAAAALVADCDLVLVGADSIGDAGIVNKIGTRVAALAARDAGVPFYVLADWSKILPRGAPQPLDVERPSDELWDGAPPGIRVWNRYFEATPTALCTGIVSDSGLCGPADLERRRARLRLPPELG
jgi:translation initiation factor 2B subunit (eIF-2B alpha/beta/delta family)